MTTEAFDHQREWALAGSELVSSVNRDDPVELVIVNIAEHARRLLDLDMCTVMTPDENQGRLLVRGSAGFSENYIRRLNTDLQLTVDRTGSTVPGPSAQAFITGEIIAIPDIAVAPSMSLWREPALAEGYAAMIATPLSQGEHIIGVLVGYSRSKREFSRELVELLAMFAVHAGATIQSANRRDELQGTIAELHEANTLLRTQRRRLELMDDQHRRLMQVMANDVGMPGVVTMLAELLGCSVAVEDAHGRVLATAAPGGGLYTGPPSAERREEPAIKAAIQQALKLRSGAARVSEDEGFWVTPVTLNNEVVALLWVGAPGFELDEVGRLGVERFALAVALEISKQRSAFQIRLRLSRDLVGDLLTEFSPQDRTPLLERAVALGHDLTERHTVIVVRADRRPGDQAPRFGIVEVVDQFVRTSAPRALSGGQREHAVILLPVEDGWRPEVLVERLLREFSRRNPGSTASAVIGHEVGDISLIAREYRVATGAIELMRARRSNAVARIDELGVAALLLSHGDPPALQHFADQMLAPLDEVDAERRDELIETVDVWLQEDRSTSRSATRLMVHANTVGYRLKTLEERLGRSLRDQAFLVDLQMALAIAKVSGTRPS